MTKFTIVGDIHIADRPPSARVDSYRSEIMDKLKWIVDYSNKQSNDALVLLGDVFHIKRPDRNSHSLVTETAEVLGSSKAPVVIVPGNHDLCVPESVEAYTDKGWRKVTELDGTEKFLTLNTDNLQAEYQVAEKINHFRYEGLGYHFQSDVFDIVTTPNHRWPVSAPILFEGKGGVVLMRKSEFLAKAPDSTHLNRFLASVQLVEKVDPGSPVQVGDVSMPLLDAASLFGWYVSQFSLDSHRGIMNKYSSRWGSPNDSNSAVRETILKPYNISYDAPNKNDLTITNESVIEYLEKTLRPEGEFVLPDWLLEAGSAFCLEFIISYMRGDIRAIHALDERTDNWASTIISEKSVVKVVTDALSQVGAFMRFADAYSVDGTYGATVIQFNRVLNTNFPRPVEVDMDEMVWCPTLPNGTWLCRSNGRVHWTGNSNDDLHSIPSQPLGTLALHPNIELLMGGHESLPIFSVPYFDPSPANYKRWVDEYHEAGGNDKYPFIGTHQAIFPKKEEPIYDYISAESWAESFGSTWVAYGHIHSRMRAGAFYSAGDTIFCNNGAISRGSLHEETIHRKLAITDFDSEASDPFVSIPIPFKPAEEVFKLDAVDILKNRQNTVDSFLKSLGSTELNYLTVEGIIEDARSKGDLPKEAVVELEDIVIQVTTEN